MPDKYDAICTYTFLQLTGVYLQVGISVLRRLGYCVPLYSISGRRPSLRQETTRFTHARVVHEARRPDSCL